MVRFNHGVVLAKGQLNSEWIYEVIFSPKMQTKNYKISALPNEQKTAYTHQKIANKSATILVCLVGQKSL